MKSSICLLLCLLVQSCSLFDRCPPNLTIHSPEDESMVQNCFIVKGTAWDNQALKSVEVAVDAQDFQQAEGLENWYCRISLESSGYHILTVRALDYMENQCVTEIGVYAE